MFLANVAALSLKIQQELVRVLDLGEVRVLGDKEYPVRIRLVAGTCDGLMDAVRAGHFRLDLYQRLAATVITVSPPTLQS